ncbi:MAG: NUDIX domain-containing protein [Clostridiales bacterium]|nr:NUDIX domain-containing protein [Clostridiales bacterium]MBQ4638416.1 NUDIX domain-containing protein [Clostridia bacterium]
MFEGKLRSMTSLYILDGEEIFLLSRKGSRVVEDDSYTGTAGGHFENDELNDAEKCVIRELFEELGLKRDDLENFSMRYVTLRLFGGEIRQNYYFFADLKRGVQMPLSNEGRIEKFALSDILVLKMPYTAKFVLEHFINIGRFDKNVYGGIASFEGVSFHRMNV